MARCRDVRGSGAPTGWSNFPSHSTRRYGSAHGPGSCRHTREWGRILTLDAICQVSRVDRISVNVLRIEEFAGDRFTIVLWPPQFCKPFGNFSLFVVRQQQP